MQKTDLTREFGLRSWCGAPQLMAHSHRHNDLELNLVERGTMIYVFSGQRMTVQAGQLVLFWAAVPHQLIEIAPDSFVRWLTLPLAWFVRQCFPQRLAQPLLAGAPVLADAQPIDTLLLQQWHADLPGVTDTKTMTDETRQVVLLELEARLRRLATTSRRARAPSSQTPTHHKAESMARWVAEHFTDDIKIADIAGAAALHPNYAMNLFRKTFGVSLIDYLTQHRVAHAQQLLLTTELGVLEVAMRAGFGSSSQFYEAFKRVCGVSPRKYREALS